MARLSYNEIFTNVRKYDETGSYTGLQIASKLNQKNGQDYKLIDAIDIDWNGVWLETANTYINDTYELINAINNIADLSELQWVKDKINELDESVDTILATYVTKEQLEEILGHYQKPVTGGEHINIDSDNIISTYGLLTPEEADETFIKIPTFESFVNEIHENYYLKHETEDVANEIAIAVVQSEVIKNADERYSDLEKISDWIISQSTFIPVKYEDIINDGSIKYYRYDSETDKYILVDSDYINEHPEEQYYIESENNLKEIEEQVQRLNNAVGYKIYDENLEKYTYTDGLLKDVYELELKSDEISENIIRVQNEVRYIGDRAETAYYTANSAYEIAYIAYESSVGSDLLAKEAYSMAYSATEKIGIKHSYAYFTELTEEDIALLIEDPSAIDVYSIKEDNQSGIPLPDHYDPNSGLIYYKYIPEVLPTGFYKDLEETYIIASDAKTSADNALFRLFARTEGTSYADIELKPDTNTGSNTRTIVLNIDEADISYETGEISNDGFITTVSLANTLSYISSFEIIGEN